MATDLADQGRYVFYLNFRTLGDGSNFAQAEQNFNYSELIDDASKYIMSIERFRVPIQTIPMVAAQEPAVQFIPKGAGAPSVLNTTDSFSIPNFLRQMNGNPNLQISLTSDGRISFSFDYTATSLLFSQEVADIFDIERSIGLTLIGVQRIIGGSPIFDRVDQLFKVQIEGRVGFSALQQEIVDTDVFQTLLTDFLVPSNFQFSSTYTVGVVPNDNFTVSMPARQSLEFNSSSNRRYIMFRGNSPVQNLQLEITAILRDGTRQRIRLPRRSLLEVKVGFWRK